MSKGFLGHSSVQAGQGLSRAQLFFFKTTGPNDKKLSSVVYMVKLDRSNVKRKYLTRLG